MEQNLGSGYLYQILGLFIDVNFYLYQKGSRLLQECVC